MCEALSLCPKPTHRDAAIAQALKTQPFTKSLHAVQGHRETLCGLCQLGASVVESELASQKSIAAIQVELKTLCNKVPQAWAAQCASLVDEVPAYVAALERKETPAVLCAQLGFCPTA